MLQHKCAIRIDVYKKLLALKHFEFIRQEILHVIHYEKGLTYDSGH